MVAAVFAQLFKGILCKGNSTPHVLLCLEGEGIMGTLLRPQ